jgi:hydrogenase maturation protease
VRDLVIAIGQTFRQDDGAASVLLQSVELPEPCLVRVLPQLLPELVDDLAGASRVLFVDAAVDRSIPTLEPIASAKSCGGFSHFATPSDLVELCRKLHGHAPNAHVLRLPAFELGFGEGLSEPLQVQLPLAQNLLRQWLSHGGDDKAFPTSDPR